MRSAVSLAVALVAACGASPELAAIVPPNTSFAIVCTEAGILEWVPGDVLRFTLGTEDVEILTYEKSASELGIEFDAKGELVQTAAEDAWELPTPLETLRLDVGEEAFVRAEAPKCKPKIRPPPCPELLIESQISISSELLDEQDVNAVALIGDTILFSTESERSPFRPNRLFFAREGEMMDEITPVTLPPGYPDGWEDDLRPMASEGRFLVVATTSTRIAVFGVELDGRVELLVEDRSLLDYGSRNAHSPGSDTLFQFHGGRVLTLALTSSASSRPLTPQLPVGRECAEPGSSIQLEGPSNGVVHGPGVFPYRFDLSGRLDPLVESPPSTSCCESAFAHLPSGAELITYNDNVELGGDRMLWRSTPSGGWTFVPKALGSLFDVTALDDRVVARNRTSTRITIIDHFTGRPEIAPWLCELDFPGVQRIAVDGDRAVAAARLAFAYELLLLRLETSP